MKKLDFSDILPHLLCIVIIYAASIIFFNKEIFDNKTLRRGDSMLFSGMSKRSNDYRRDNGEQTLWNDAMFGGMPDYLIAMGINSGPIKWIKRALAGFISKNTATHILFTLTLCFWILLLSYQVNPYLSVAGALAFAFSTYFIINIEVGHVTKAWATAYGVLILAGIRLVFRHKYLLGFGLTCMGLALELSANHLQITFYLVFICLIMVISELYYDARSHAFNIFFKKGIILATAVLLATLTGVCRLWTTQDYTQYSIRGDRLLSPLENATQYHKSGLDRNYAFAWSQGKTETFTLLIPNFYGGSSTAKLPKDSQAYQLLEDNLRNVANAVRNKQISQAQYAQMRTQIEQAKQYAPLYWGDQPFTEGPLYAGAVVCFLFVLALMILDNKQRWWILAGVLLSMILAWGKNFSILNYLLFDYIPGFNKFRSVSMALSMALTLMPLAAVLAVDKLFKHSGQIKNVYNKLLLAAGLTGGLCLLLWLAVGAGFFSFKGISDGEGAFFEAILSDRKTLLKSDALRSFFLIACAFGLIWLFLKKKIGKTVLVLTLALLMVGDLWQVAKRYIYDDKFEPKRIKNERKPSVADNKILQDTALTYRVLPLSNPFNNSDVSYFHRSIGGYHAAKMRRYQDLIERKITPEIESLIKNIRAGTPDFSKTPILNMLDTKYLKINDQAKGVIANPAALGNVWFVEKLLIAEDADQEMALLATQDPAKNATINISKSSVSKTNFIVDSTANISLTMYSPRRLTYESTNEHEGLAVFSEIYYPAGWVATIDNKIIEIKCVNYVLRGLQIPAGKHTIRFEFKPDSYLTGIKITTLGNYFVFFAFLMGMCWEAYRKLTVENN